MSTLTQQRAVEIAEERLGYPSFGVFNDVREKDLIAAMEQYHREASQQASVEPAAYMQEYWSPDCGPQYEIYKADDMTWRDKSNWTPLYTAPPDAEALRKRVGMLKVLLSGTRNALTRQSEINSAQISALVAERDEARAEAERLIGLLREAVEVRDGQSWPMLGGAENAEKRRLLWKRIDAARAARKEG